MVVIDNYNIKIYDPTMKLLAILNNAYDISYELTLNELWTCAFKMPKDDKKNEYCQPFYFVELFDGGERVELFRILPHVLTREDTAFIEYECEHVLATLLDDVMFKYHQIGNLGVYTDRVIRYVLDNQVTKQWQLIRTDFRRQFEYKWENENLLSALFSIPKPFNEQYKWTFDTTSYPWGISLVELNTRYVGDIQYKKNMQNITKTVDPTQLVTRLYALGFGEGDNQLDITSVNNGVPYLEKNVGKYGLKQSILTDRRFENPETLKEYARSVLDGLSEPYVSYDIKGVDLSVYDSRKYPKFRPGDYILIRDFEDGINLEMPIVKVSKGDVKGNPFDVDLEIANKNRDITGSISELMERSRINETYSQGATNLQQIVTADNADATHPLQIKFYIPNEMARINKLILNYTIEAFRAYMKGVASGGGSYNSTSAGGGSYSSTSTDSGGGSYNSQTTSVDNYTMTGRGHNHGIPNMTEIFTHNNPDGSPRWIGTFRESGDHTHSVTMSVNPHSHSVQFRTNDHTHSVSIGNHTHNPEYGIYESSRADYCTLKIDGVAVNTQEKEVNIIPYLSKDDSGRIQRGTWHTVEIVPNKLTRINASIFIQLFTNSRGGGDY